MNAIVAQRQRDPNEFISGINTPDTDVTFLGAGLFLKLAVFVVVLGYIVYSFLLLLRVRILSDTLNVPLNRQVKGLVTLNLLFAVVGGIVATFIIILA